MASHVFNSYGDACTFINGLEDDTLSNFPVAKRSKDVNTSAVTNVDRKIQWEERKGMVPIHFDGVPYLLISKEVRECHQGHNKRKHSGKRKESDHTYGRKRSNLQNSKKMDCEMKIHIRIIVKFPEFALTQDSPIERRKTSKKLKENFSAATVQQCQVLLRVIGDHTNHLTGELAGYGLPLDRSVKQKIASLVLDEGLRDANDIKRLVDLQSKVLHPGIETSVRKYFPTAQDVRNHIHIALKQKRYSGDDQKNVAGLVNAWKSKSPNDLFFFRPSSVEQELFEPLLFVHQSQFQKKLLNKYGSDVVLMDSTYNTSKYQLPLFFICVLTNVGYFVVATFITGNESKDQISEALRVLKESNPSWQPKAFMCDMDQREIGAIESTFADSPVYLCEFHREQAWDRWFNKNINGAKEDKKEIIQCLRRIANSSTQNDFNQNLDTLQSMKLYQENSRFQSWINRQWLENKERWVHCYRRNIMLAKINTTNGVEAQNKIFKHKYLKKAGGTKTLTSLITVLTQEFVPDSKQRYIRENTRASANNRKYSDSIPQFLHNRPKTFVNHCLKRLSSSVTVTDPTTEGALVIGEVGISYRVNLLEPSCTCPDWKKLNWPCKHMLAVIRREGEFNWHLLPDIYTSLPCFNLDNLDSYDIQHNSDIITESSAVTFNIRDELIGTLKDIQNEVYIAPDNILNVVKTHLENAKVAITQNKSCQLPVRRPKKSKKNTQFLSSPKENKVPDTTDDEIGTLLHTIWTEETSSEPLVKVGAFTLTYESIKSVKERLADEVMDSYLTLLCQKAVQKALLIPTILCTAIFTGQQHLHGLLSTENLFDYDLCLGAINEGGNHWTLVIIIPKQKQILYLNSMGENNHTEQILVQHWYSFLNERHRFSIDENQPGMWKLHSPIHARQRDSLSCGIYVLQFAELFLSQESLDFTWSPRDIQQARMRIARSLLGEGVPCTCSEDKGLPSSNLESEEEESDMDNVHKLGSAAEPEDKSKQEDTVMDYEHSDEPDENSKQEDTVMDYEHSDEPDENSVIRTSARGRVPKRKRDSFAYPKPKAKARLYCVCRQKNDGSEYWQCETCLEWFHPACLNIKLVQEPAHFECKDCKSSQIKNLKTPEYETDDQTSSDEENDLNIDNSFLFSSELLQKVVHIGIKWVHCIVTSVISNKDPSMGRHNAFRRGGRKELKGYGYSLFSTLAIHNLTEKLKEEFFTDKTRNYYISHGKIKHLKDQRLIKMFENDRFLANCYIKEVCLCEAMAAIVMETLQLDYSTADKLLEEVENKSDIRATMAAFSKRHINKEKYLGKLQTYLEQI